MRFAVLVFPGSNCDHDAYHAIKHVLGEHAEYVWHKDHNLKDFDAVIIPGGFSYGDYLRSGAIARFSPIMQNVQKFARSGGPVLGICNGFQILVEAGMLPGALISNQNLRFISRMVYIKPEHTDSVFTTGLDTHRCYKMPIAHHDGNYFTTDRELKDLEANGQIAFRYATSGGDVVPRANPNGSVANIAGVMNLERNVLGLMPHPERAVELIVGSADGLELFRSIQGYR